MVKFSNVMHHLGMFRRVEDAASPVTIPPVIYNKRIYLIAFAAAFGAVICGYDTGFIGSVVTLESFESEFGLDQMSQSAVTRVNANIISIFHVGAFFGALLTYPLSELLGRKISLLVSGFLLTFGGALSLVSKNSTGLGAIYASRVLTGLGVGSCSNTAPIYIGEIAPHAIRGQLIGMWEINWQIGTLVGFWINLGISEHIPLSAKQWRIPFLVQIIPSALFWIGSFFVPESPRWLLTKHKAEKARKNFSILRRLPEDHEFINYEVETIEYALEKKRHVLGSESIFAPIRVVFTSKKYLYRLLISTSTFPMQNGSGINAVTYYSTTVFQSFGLSSQTTRLLSTGVFGIIKAVAGVIWMVVIIDTLGRRALFFWGSIPCAIAMYYLGAYIKIENPDEKLATGDVSLDSAGKGALAMFYIWSFTFGAFINGTCWTYCAELVDQHVRGLFQSINASSNWFWAFIFARFTRYMFNAMGYGTYFLFAGCCTVTPIIIYCFYPETKGVPLEAVDYLFEVPAWRGRQYALDKLRTLEKISLQEETKLDSFNESSEDLDAKRS